MKQKADHHLEFLADPNDKPAGMPGQAVAHITSKGSQSKRGRSTSFRAQSVAPVNNASNSHNGPGGDEDAAGESDDAVGEGDDSIGQDFQNGAGRRGSAEGANQPGGCELSHQLCKPRAPDCLGGFIMDWIANA